MKERDIERYFKRRVEQAGGKSYKFVSPSNRGVSDRIVCLPDGSTWFVELKAPGGELSALQEVFRADMCELKQKYACLWSKEDADLWLTQALAEKTDATRN